MHLPFRIPRSAIALGAVVALTVGGWSAASAIGGDPGGRINPPTAADGQAQRSAAGTRVLPPAAAASKTENFTGITPCRIFDTRPATPLANTTRNFKVSGTLSGQGGSNTCGVPTNATGIVVNLTGISTGGNGFIRGWAFGAAPATATLLNFGPAINVSNQVNIPLCKTSCGGNGFTLKAFGTADIVGDAVGYYTAPLYALVQGNGTVLDGISSGLLVSGRTSVGHYDFLFDRDVTHCAVVASDLIFAANREVSVDAVDFSGGELQVEVRDYNNDAVDTAFYISITC